MARLWLSQSKVCLSACLSHRHIVDFVFHTIRYLICDKIIITRLAVVANKYLIILIYYTYKNCCYLQFFKYIVTWGRSYKQTEPRRTNEGKVFKQYLIRVALNASRNQWLKNVLSTTTWFAYPTYIYRWNRFLKLLLKFYLHLLNLSKIWEKEAEQVPMSVWPTICNIHYLHKISCDMVSAQKTKHVCYKLFFGCRVH